MGRDGGAYGFDLGKMRSNIFLQTGLDRKSAAICPAGQIVRTFGRAHAWHAIKEKGAERPLVYHCSPESRGGDGARDQAFALLAATLTWWLSIWWSSSLDRSFRLCLLRLSGLGRYR